MARLRKWNTLRTLSIEPVQKHLVNGRIHCSFNQLAKDDDDDKGTKGARYGRLSCEHVNMQQQPARDEDIGAIWRRIYMPDEGGLWAANDYSQQEPRMAVHFAEICGLAGGTEAANRYRNDPDTDYHDMMTEMVFGYTRDNIDKDTFKTARTQCKAIYLGLSYGMGQEKLCNDLGLPTKVITLTRGPRKGQKMVVAGSEGEKLFETFHARVPFIKGLSNMTEERANEKGYIKTLLGRRCRFPKTKDGLNYMWTYRAFNRLIQGSSADQTKKAMVEADRAGFKLQLQVHDEIDLTVENREEAEALADIMMNCIQLRVPSKVDVEIGPSWGEAA